MSWVSFFWIGLGGAIGSMFRAAIAMSISSEFPWATLIANVTGCLIIGIVMGHESVTADWSQHSRGFVVVGFCGGFTTFSTFGLQTLRQLESGNLVAALANIFLSVIVCLVAVWVGIKLGKLVFQGG